MGGDGCYRARAGETENRRVWQTNRRIMRYKDMWKVAVGKRWKEKEDIENTFFFFILLMYLGYFQKNRCVISQPRERLSAIFIF